MMPLQQIIQTGGMSSADQSELLAYMKANPDFAAEAAGIASKYSGLIEAEAKKAAESAKKAEAPTTKQVKTINPVNSDHSANARMLENDEFAKAIAALEAGPITIPEFKPQRVYHGSTARGLDHIGFSLKTIGTGSGANAYGAGVYFAQKKEMAQKFYEEAGALGDLYEAEIPHNNYLLDYNKPFSQQSEYVQNALRKERSFAPLIATDELGMEFQLSLSKVGTRTIEETDKARLAKSKLLHDLGIKGNFHNYGRFGIESIAYAIYDPTDITNVKSLINPISAEEAHTRAAETPKVAVDKDISEDAKFLKGVENLSKQSGDTQVKPVNEIPGSQSANDRMPGNTEVMGPPKATMAQKIEMARESERLSAEPPKVAEVVNTPQSKVSAPKASKPQVKATKVIGTEVQPQVPAVNSIAPKHSANKSMAKAARPNVTPPPVRSANNPNPNSWTSILQDTTIHALDIETTSTQAGKARIYNIGVSQFRNRQTISSTDHFIGGLVKPHRKESVEDQLLRLHTTPNARRFGKEQKARGVFKRYAEASQYTTVDAAFSDFSNQLASTNGKRFILGQNLNFENGMFKSALGANGEQALSQEAVEAYNIAAGRTGLHKSTTDLFKEYKVIENLKDKNNPEGTQGFFNTFKKMLETRQQHTADEMHEALGNYAGAYDRVVDAYKDLIEAGAKSGNAPVADLLDITRATYARAAMAGDMEPEFIGHGSSIEFLLQGLFGESEKHIGGEDNASAEKIFYKLAEEHDKYRADPTYKSKKIQGLNQRFKDTDELHTSFVKGISNRLEERATQAKSLKGFLAQAQGALDDGLHYSSHLNIGRTARVNIHSVVSQAIADMPARHDTPAKANKYLEEVLQSASTSNQEVARATETAVKSSTQTLKTKLLNKKVLIGVGALVAANMLFTGDKRSTEDYNTYDELYNNQYYGTQFADWQARNKHHKMIY